MGRRKRRDQRSFDLRKQANESKAEFTKRISKHTPKPKRAKKAAAE